MANDPETDRNVPPHSIPDLDSPTPEVDVDAKDQLIQLLANADTWYIILDAVVRRVLLKYNILHIASMFAFSRRWKSGLARLHTSLPCIAN